MKYNNKIIDYQGEKFHSELEFGYFVELKRRKMAHDIKDFHRQIKFDLESNGKKVGTYTIDFKIIHNDDTIEFVEVKGYPEELWILKWNILLAMIKDDPGISFTIACNNNTKEKLKKKNGVFIHPTNWYIL